MKAEGDRRNLVADVDLGDEVSEAVGDARKAQRPTED